MAVIPDFNKDYRMTDPAGFVETFAPWTIKSFSVQARKEIIAAAQQQNMQVGPFLERVWRAYLADGSPVQVGPVQAGSVAVPSSSVSLAALATLAQAAREMATAAGIAPPPSLAKQLMALTAAQARAARGLSPRAARGAFAPKALAAPEKTPVQEKKERAAAVRRGMAS